jgi:hypothetical protein
MLADVVHLRDVRALDGRRAPRPLSRTLVRDASAWAPVSRFSTSLRWSTRSSASQASPMPPAPSRHFTTQRSAITSSGAIAVVISGAGTASLPSLFRETDVPDFSGVRGSP